MKPHYYSLNEYLHETYGHKMYKISLNGGMSCPNRDGNIDTRGCIFCSSGGSGDFAADSNISIISQIKQAKSLIKSKYSGEFFIAYFQAYTNTYAPVSYLRELFTEVIQRDDIAILSIATRPDCLSTEIVNLLNELNKIKPVWIELGLQTIHSCSAKYIRRGYELPIFDNAVDILHKNNIKVIAHMIIGLPNETLEMILQTADYIAKKQIFGIKLQLLHVLKNTDLATDYANGFFETMQMDEYIKCIGQILEILPSNMVIHRLTGDGPKKLLIDPLWSSNKKLVLNQLNCYLKNNNIIQGRNFK